MRLYTWRRTGLADEVGSDAIPDAAGGEGGHGAAKPDGVIHRYVFNQSQKTRDLLINYVGRSLQQKRVISGSIIKPLNVY